MIDFRKISNSRLVVEATTDGCRDTINEVRYVEHVQAKISLQYHRRGDLQIFLVSPNGTRTTLLQKRKNDKQERDFHDWPFMSVHFWGEQPVGTWTLEMENVGPDDNSGKDGQCLSFFCVVSYIFFWWDPIGHFQ